MKFMLTTILIEWWICTSSTTQGGGGSFRNRIPMGYYERGVLLWFLDGRALRLAGSLSLSLSPSLLLSLSLSFSLSLSIFLSSYPSIIPSVYPSHDLPIHPSVHPSHPPIHLSVYLSIYHSIYHSIYLSVRRLHTALHHTRTMSHLQGNKFSCHLCKGLLTLGGNLRNWRNPARWDGEPCFCALVLQIKNCPSVRPSLSPSLLLSLSN